MSNDCNFFSNNDCCTIKGDKGEKGEIGFTGMQGNKGEQGVKGEKGEPADVEQDININSIRVKTGRITEKIKVKKISGLNELGVTASNTLDVNSNIIPAASTIDPNNRESYRNYNLGSEQTPWSTLYSINVDTDNIDSNKITSSDISILNLKPKENEDIFIDGNLITNNNFNIGSNLNRWSNIYTKNIDSTRLNASDIEVTNLNGDTVVANLVNAVDISSSNIKVVDISSVNVKTESLNALFDISGMNIYGNTINTTNTNTINLKVNEIISGDSENSIKFNSDIITDSSQNTIGNENNLWHNAFFNNITLNNIKTNDISKNLLFETNLLPSGIKDVSNITQLDIGSNDNIWNKAFINDISVNRIGGLSDLSKNILVEGNLIPEGPYSNNTSKYSIGARGKEWKDLYISTGTIYIGGAALGINEVIEENKKKIQLVFYPSTTQDLPENNNNNETSEEESPPAIVLTSAEFNVVSEQDNDTGETKEVLEPIEETFATGKLLDLEDVDISKNELQNGDIIMYDESKEKFVIGEAAVANNSNQTLLEVLSEQPQKFNFVNSNTTSGSITLEWNYEDIIVNYDDNTHRLLSKGDNLKDKMIPYIDKIHVDISGTIHGLSNNANNNNWIPYNSGDYDSNGNRTISNNDSYNTSSYKVLNISKTQSSSLNNNSSLTERILSEPVVPISFRIYGINDSKDNDTLKNTRALYFNNLSFLSASAPKKPIFQSENITNSEINLVYRTSEVEEGNIESSAKIIKAEVKYNEVERNNSNTNLFSSAPYIVNSNEQNENIDYTLTDNIINNSPIPIQIDNFRPGTKYSYSILLTNNLISTQSESSDVYQSTIFTNPPSSNLLSNQLYFLIKDNDKTFITSKTLTSQNRIYLNIGESDTSKVVLNPKVSNNANDNNPQNNVDIELSSDFRFGKDLDGTEGSNIVNIDVYVDTTHKQKVTFNGYNASLNVSNFNNLTNIRTVNQNGVNTFYFISDTTTQNDLYNDNSIANYQDKMGFRLKANVIMNSIKISDVRQNISNSGSETPFSLKYEYTRKGKLYQDNNDVVSSNSFDLFIDNLNVDPSFPINSRKQPTIKVKNVIYCMGIPTVHKFDVIFDTTQQNSSRIYKNINSSFGFMRGDLKIGDIQIIGDTISLVSSKTAVKEIKLKNNGLIKDVLNQEYNLSETNFSSDITSYFENFQYTENNYNTTNNIKVKEKIYSLRTGDDGLSQEDMILNTKHYCDYNSFNNFTSNNPTLKITNTIVEIETITELASNIGNIQISDYSHEDLVKNHTLLFINGLFQTNQKQSYPIVNNYLYQSTTLENNGYTSSMATTAYGIDGTTTTVEKKYKWIGFKLTSSNVTLDTNTNISFVNINSILRKYFTETTFDKLKTNDTDVIGFIKVQNSVGNLSRNYNTLSPWDGITSATSLANIFDNVNKGTIYNKTSTEWGPVVNPSNTLNGIFIFIGLNNSVAL